MKILVFADSHGTLETMYRAVEAERPDALVHLGDYWQDGTCLHEKYPQIPFYQVAGNCDIYQCGPDDPEILIRDFEDVTVYMTHGHRQHVKGSLMGLTLAAQEAGAQVALFGHTHVALEDEMSDVMLINPGTCSIRNGTYAILEIDGDLAESRIQSLAALDWRNEE